MLAFVRGARVDLQCFLKRGVDSPDLDAESGEREQNCYDGKGDEAVIPLGVHGLFLLSSFCPTDQQLRHF